MNTISNMPRNTSLQLVSRKGDKLVTIVNDILYSDDNRRVIPLGSTGLRRGALTQVPSYSFLKSGINLADRSFDTIRAGNSDSKPVVPTIPTRPTF